MNRKQIISYIKKERNINSKLDLSKINGVWYFIGDTIDYSKETCTHAVRLSDYSLSLWLETYDQMSTN